MDEAGHGVGQGGEENGLDMLYELMLQGIGWREFMKAPVVGKVEFGDRPLRVERQDKVVRTRVASLFFRTAFVRVSLGQRTHRELGLAGVDARANVVADPDRVVRGDAADGDPLAQAQIRAENPWIVFAVDETVHHIHPPIRSRILAARVGIVVDPGVKVEYRVQFAYGTEKTNAEQVALTADMTGRNLAYGVGQAFGIRAGR